MRWCQLLLMPVLGSAMALAQPPDDMAAVCENAVNQSTTDAETLATLRAGCAQIAQCSSKCNGLISDPNAFGSCVADCASLNDSPPNQHPSTTSVDAKPPDTGAKDIKDDKAANKDALCKQAADFRDHQLFQLWDAEQKNIPCIPKAATIKRSCALTPPR